MADRTLFLISAAALAVIVGGCIVSDRITTLTIHEDGSADWIRFQSNIHSSEPGEKGAAELRRFVEAFDRREDDEFRRIAEAGGKVKEARWLRSEEPYANVVAAHLPDAAALQAFYTIKNGTGEAMARGRFSKDGERRRFSIVIPASEAAKLGGEKKSVRELRQGQADGVSEIRMVASGGRIVDSAGFTVAGDRRSALLELSAIDGLVTGGGKDVELFLEWELTGDESAARANRF